MLAVPLPDVFQHRPGPLILSGVVQQRGDRLIFVAPILDHERTDAEKVANIGDAAAFPDLGSMDSGGELKRLLEALA